MFDFAKAITAIESGGLVGNEFDTAMHASMSALIARGPGYWDTPDGERLRPLWDDWVDALEADIRVMTAEIDRRLLTNDYEGVPPPPPFRLPNGLMSNDPWAFGDPFEF